MATREEQKNQKIKKIGKKNNWKNQNMKKNRLKFWKNWLVWFRFYKSKTEKIEPQKTWNNPSQTEKIKPNRKYQIKPVWINFYPKKSNQTKLKIMIFNDNARRWRRERNKKQWLLSVSME
jgi:hypothetical protein